MERLYFILVGIVMLVPFSIEFYGTDIFYVQHVFILITFVYFLFFTKNIKIPLSNNIDKAFIIYLTWINVTYILNALMFFYSFDTDIEVHRLASLFMSLSLLCGYIIGRYFLHNVENNMIYLMYGMIGTFSIMNMFYLTSLYTAGLNDLFAIRDLIGQRIPSVICFLTTISGVLIVYWRYARLYLIPLFILGVILIILSLTRAVYIQLGIGILMIIYMYLKKYPQKALIALLLIIVLINIINIKFGNIGGYEQIQDRFALLINISEQIEVDPSGSFRISMWNELAKKLSEFPIRWLTGYGELGPSFVAKDIPSVTGVIIASSAHSEYFDIIIRDGIIGLMIFIYIYYKVVTMGLFKIKYFKNSIRPIIIGHSVALIGILFYGLFHESVRYFQFGFYYWIYVGIMSNMLSEKRNKIIHT